MRERVSCILGKLPVILVAPHGADDTNTAIIAETAAKQLNCFAVINRGFERDHVVDVDKDKADCNRIDHVKQDVIFEEYLKPIIKFQNKLATKNSRGIGGWWSTYNYDPVHIFHIHGCGNIVHSEADEQVEVVIGYGLGIKKHSLSCEEWRKNVFVEIYRRYAMDGEVYVGKGGGRYAGRDSNNMNQYFRKHHESSWVNSMQLEFPYSARDTESRAVTTAMCLSVVITDYLQHTRYDPVPEIKLI